VAIDVHIQDESGNTIAQYEGPPLGLHFLKLAPASSACFRFIVPWGDATFNEEQTRVLKSELQDAASRTTEPARLRELRALQEFLAGASGAHTYVKFIGD
jgi:hypothetical protein